MSEELNISTALNDIYEAATGIKVLGNVVDQNEFGYIPFSTVGTGNLILTEAIHALYAIEDDLDPQEQTETRGMVNRLRDIKEQWMESEHEKDL